MDGVALVVLGAVIGAAATGGVQAWSAYKRRLLDRKVAARAILVDLYLSQALLEGVLEEEEWPARLDNERPLDTWREFRGPFAAAVTGKEWAIVDRVYAVLHQVTLAASLGQPSVEPAKPLVSGLLTRVRAARAIAADHAADSDVEREEIELVLEDPY